MKMIRIQTFLPASLVEAIDKRLVTAGTKLELRGIKRSDYIRGLVIAGAEREGILDEEEDGIDLREAERMANGESRPFEVGQ